METLDILCISMVQFSCTPQFTGVDRLRKGNPLYPPLFIIVMEALSTMLERTRRGNYISGFSVSGHSGGQLEISHLLFVDDMLIFCGVDPEQIWHLKTVFVWF